MELATAIQYQWPHGPTTQRPGPGCPSRSGTQTDSMELHKDTHRVAIPPTHPDSRPAPAPQR
jgi:hypothetical protein